MLLMHSDSTEVLGATTRVGGGEGEGEVGVLSCGGLGGGEGVVAYEERHHHDEEGVPVEAIATERLSPIATERLSPSRR